MVPMHKAKYIGKDTTMFFFTLQNFLIIQGGIR
jgi:hypothetical protein